MIFDAVKGIDAPGIPKRAMLEWNTVILNINRTEDEQIRRWINEKFDEISISKSKVTPAGWLGSGFAWNGTPLEPIYRESCNYMSTASQEEKEAKAGQIFGLYISSTLSERDETWFFVKGEEYEANGVPITSRIYFLPE